MIHNLPHLRLEDAAEFQPDTAHSINIKKPRGLCVEEVLRKEAYDEDAAWKEEARYFRGTCPGKYDEAKAVEAVEDARIREILDVVNSLTNWQLLAAAFFFHVTNKEADVLQFIQRLWPPITLVPPSVSNVVWLLRSQMEALLAQAKKGGNDLRGFILDPPLRRIYSPGSAVREDLLLNPAMHRHWWSGEDEEEPRTKLAASDDSDEKLNVVELYLVRESISLPRPHIDYHALPTSGDSAVCKKNVTDNIVRLLDAYPCPKKHTGVSDGDRAFAIHGALTLAECNFLVATALPRLESLDTHFHQQYRVSDRAMIRSPTLAAQIFSRIMPHLTREDHVDRIPLCFRQDGQWLPIGCNECLKIVRYNPGGHFSAHRDAPWLPDEDQASIYTILIYLNDDFRGGATQLCHIPPEGARATFEAPTLIVVPLTGTALLFNHDMWHSGHPVLDGCKWVLRTELIFQRVATHFVDRYLHTSDEEFNECRALYEGSMAALKRGDRRLFAEQYQRVVHMQREAMLDVVACRARSARLLAALSDDVFCEVLQLMEDVELVKLMCVSKATLYAVLQSTVWEMKVLREYPACAAEVAKIILSEVPRDATGMEPLASEQQRIVGRGFRELPVDWKRVYSHERMKARGAPTFQPATLFVTESAGTLIALNKFAPLQVAFPERSMDNRYEYTTGEAIQFSSTLTNAVGAFAPHPIDILCLAPFATLNFGDPFHMNIPPSQRFVVRDCTMGVHQPSIMFTHWKDVIGADGLAELRTPLVGSDGEVKWSIIAHELQPLFSPIWTPVTVVGHPSWFLDGREEQLARQRKDLFVLLRCPAVVIAHPAACLISRRCASHRGLPAASPPALALVFIRTSANAGGEYCSVVDLRSLRVTRTLRSAPATPASAAATAAGTATAAADDDDHYVSGAAQLAVQLRESGALPDDLSAVEFALAADLHVSSSVLLSTDLSASTTAGRQGSDGEWLGPAIVLKALGLPTELLETHGAERGGAAKDQLGGIVSVLAGALSISSCAAYRNFCTFKY